MSETININTYPIEETITVETVNDVTTVNVNVIQSTGAVTSVNEQTGDVVLTPNNIGALAVDGSNANQNIDLSGYNFTANEIITQNRFSGNGYYLNNTGSSQVGLYATATDELIAVLDTLGDKIYKYANGYLTYNETTNELKWNGNIIATLADIPDLSNYATTTQLGTKQDVLTASNTHTFVDGLTAMTTPVDADRMTIIDNSVSLAKKITWANIKATLKTYFDGIYTTTSAVATQITTALSGYLTTATASTTYATKSMGAYSFRVNNTNATADSTETVYKALGKQTLSATGIAFTGTTAPSGTATLTYNYNRIGNVVTATFTLLYTVAGSAITAVSIPFPTDLPTPVQPNGFTSASEKLYLGNGQLGTNKTVVGTAGTSAIRNNSANTGFDFVIITTTSSNMITATGTIIYFTS